MEINLYTPRSMMALVKRVLPVRTFLKSTFFNDIKQFETERIDVDFVKGGRKMAPFVSPTIGSQAIKREGYTTNTYTAPFIAPTSIITGIDIINRLPGESLYGGMSPDERKAIMLIDDLSEKERMIARREEWMCAQVLTTGKVHVVNEDMGVNDLIDFNHTNKETLPTAKKWSATGGNPIADLKRWRLDIIKKTGITPKIVIMASNVVDAFLANEHVQKIMDIKRINIGKIEASALPDGITRVATIDMLGLEVCSYDEWYLDDWTNPENPIAAPMIPDGTVILLSPDANFKMLYGAYVDVNAGTFSLPRIARSWTKNDPPQRYVQLISRPLPIPFDVDSWGVYTVL